MKRIRSIYKQSDPAEKSGFDLYDESKKREDPFLVPQDYFDELPQRIMDRIAADSQKKLENPQASPFLRKVWLAAAAAAAIAVIFMMIKPATEVPATKSKADISASAEKLSVDYDQTYAEEALMLEETSITDKDALAIDLKTMGNALFTTDTTSVGTEEIIQYLLDNNYDSDLLAEL